MAGMASNPVLWTLIGSSSIAASSYMAYRNLSLQSLPSLLGLTAPGGVWRVLAIVFALLNLKSLPFGWHLRVLYGLLRHVYPFKSRPPPLHPPGSLFQPVITSTTCSLMEMDYNLHKSNSMYFQDLDISRMHAMCCVLRSGLHKTHFQTTPEVQESAKKGGRFAIIFGGIQCSFRREIKPYQSYEIWTRILAWDRKWLYLVSHIVKKGAVKPKGYTMQPWKKGAKAKTKEDKDIRANGNANGSAESMRAPHPAILATSVSKYVFKQGRITISPEEALRTSDLLPPKPDTAPDDTAQLLTPPDSGAETPAHNVKATEDAAGAAASLVSAVLPEGKAVALAPVLELDAFANWDWETVEKERQRGMLIAQHLAGLDDAAEAWSGEEWMAMGEF